MRLGLLLESLLQPAWAVAAVEQLLEDPGARLVVTAVAARGVEPACAGRLAALRSHGLVKAFDRFDARIFRHDPDPFKVESVGPLVAGTTTVYCMWSLTSGRWTLPAQDIETIRGADLDVLLYLGEERVFDVGTIKVARHGLWCLEHGSPAPYPGAAGGFWETLAGELTVRSSLKALTDVDEERDLCSSVFATHLTSVARTRASIYWTSAAFPSRALKAALMLDPVDTGTPAPGRAQQRIAGTVIPSESANRMFARRLPRYARRVARTALTQMSARRQWFLLLAPEQEALVPSLAQAQRIVPPRDRFWADPHMVSREGRYFVFVEELPFATGRGRIAVLVLDDSGSVEGPFTVLERPYHLSYPFVFEHDGDLFMIPESEQNETVELYRCVRFPMEWEFVRNLMEHVSAADSTLLKHDGLWWLFTCMRRSRGENLYTELCLFSSADPIDGHWQAHPENPIVSDERRARPAGPIFTRHGRLYRPAQHFVDGQGRAVAINEIVRLSQGDYAERLIARLTPDWERGVAGCHTLTRSGGLIAVDAYRWRSRFT